MVGDHAAGVCWPIRGPPPRHRPAPSGNWEQERGPPLSGRRYDHDDEPAARRPPRGAAAAAPESAGRTRLHLWSSGDLLARSGAAVVTAALYLALSCRSLTGSVVPLLVRRRSVALAWPTRGTFAVAGFGSDGSRASKSRRSVAATGNAPSASRRERSESLLRRPRWSASCDGKSAARIPAPERHDGLTVGTTSEREVERRNHHGSARARQQEARGPLMKAFASTDPEGAAVGPHGSRSAIVARSRQ